MTSKPILHKLASLPRILDLFVWCDYIELRCLVHPDKTFSRGDLTETQEEMAETQRDVVDEGDFQVAQDYDLTYEEFLSDEGLNSPAFKQDRLSYQAAIRFNHLGFRESLFGEDFYPFYLDEEKQSLSLKNDLTDWHNLYIQLLISSVLKYCPSSRRKDLTDPFEKIGLEIFKCLMPSGWEVHSFGKDSSDRYRGHLFDKLSQLAKDVRGRILSEKKHFKEKDYGDGGLDIVAWHPMEDNRSLIPIAFAQCGCTASDFEMKILEASPSKLGHHFHTGHQWATYYFMPQSMHAEDDWFRFSDLGRSIIVDRIRIMRLAKRYKVDASSLIVRETVEEAKTMSVQ